MRKIIFALAMVMGLTMMAETVTFDFAGNEFNLPTTTNTSDKSKWLSEPISKGGITIAPFKGSATIGALLYYSEYNNTLNLRFYQGSWFTITSTTGATITTIEFKSNGKLAIDDTPDGEWSGDTYETWNGEAASVRFDVTDKAQINSITVTTAAGSQSCAAPDIYPSYTRLYEPTLIELKCPTEGATIFYTTNGDEPTVESTPYSAPFLISDYTTVKAIAVKGNATSDVAVKQYEFPDHGVVTDVKSFTNDDSEGEVKLACELYAVYHSGKYMYATDGLGGYLQVYGELPVKYETGDVIPAGIVGTLNNYRGTPQMIPVGTTFKASTGKRIVLPVASAVSNVTPEYTNTYVLVRNALVTKQKKGNNYEYYVADESGSVVIFNRFKEVTLPDEEGRYDVVGVANYFDETVQLYPISFSTPATPGDVTGNGEVDVTDVVGIANTVMGDAPSEFNPLTADMNGDGSIDVTDVVKLANRVMGN